MKRIVTMFALAAGCGEGSSPAVPDTAVERIEPSLVGEAPDCGDVGGAPATAVPARIEGASDDLRAFVLGDGRVACVGVVEIARPTGGTPPGAAIDDPAAVAPESARLDEEESDGEPPPAASDCAACGKDPEPMGPDQPADDPSE